MEPEILALPLIGRRAEVLPDSVNAETREIDIVWTTGATVQRVRWEGWDDRIEYDEELVVSPEAIRLDRINTGAPFLNSHSTWGLESVLGSVVDGSVRIEGGHGTAKIRLTSAPGAADIVHRILEKTIRHVSVGYRVHQYEITKKEGARELWRAVDWEPFEISAVAIPADAGAHIRSETPGHATSPCTFIRAVPAASAVKPEKGRKMDPEDDPAAGQGSGANDQNRAPAQQPDAVAIERQRANDILVLCQRHDMADRATAMISGGMTIEAVRSTILDELEARTAAVRGRTEPNLGGRLDETETRRLGMEEALIAGLTGSAPTERARSFVGHSLTELAVERLGERRVPGGFGAREEILRRAFMSTSDFPLLFENALNRSLAARYKAALPTYRRIARQRTYQDFRDHSSVRVGDFPTLQPVGLEAGELKAGGFSEAREKTRVMPYGVMVNLSRQMLVNDTLDGITQVLNDRGAAVGRFEDATFYAMMLSASGAGPTLTETGRAVFNTTDLTLAAANAAISIASLTIGRASLRKRKSLDLADLDLTASILLVGPDKETEAQQIVAPIQAQQAGNVNPFSGTLSVVTTAKITGNAWYLFASPDEAPCFEWGLLDGYDAPRFRIEEVFGRQGTSLSLEHDFGCGAIDFRGGFRNAGA